MTTGPRRAIAWFRRDLRLIDNRMLATATQEAARVWPVFVVDPAELDRHATARGRVAWFAATAAALDARLRESGSGLTLLRGRPREVLPQFAASVDAELTYASADEDPTAVARDRRVGESLALRLIDDGRIVPPAELRTGDGGPYTVYSPFRRALDRLIDADAGHARAAHADLSHLAPVAGSPPGPFAAGTSISLPDAGEVAATARLRAFLRHDVADYGDARDVPALDATSHLSPYLRVGAISVRAAWRAAINAAERGRERGDVGLVRSAARWRGELAWREFFAHVLAAHPRLVNESFRPAYDGVEWVTGDEADDHLEAWRAGRTGYPFVDAGMRQLLATGWMHNRARLVTASFLVKDLGLDWRRGESVFGEHLLDADTQQNNGNWQWVAGVGTDAAPYFRIFNPTTQAKRFDPDGAYIRRWLPELAGVADEHLHEPWIAPRAPHGYPPPIVDHTEARRRTLQRYQAVDPARG
jgi:deoxyribodipyrimidine photo-lyase